MDENQTKYFLLKRFFVSKNAQNIHIRYLLLCSTPAKNSLYFIFPPNRENNIPLSKIFFCYNHHNKMCVPSTYNDLFIFSFLNVNIIKIRPTKMYISSIYIYSFIVFHFHVFYYFRRSEKKTKTNAYKCHADKKYCSVLIFIFS